METIAASAPTNTSPLSSPAFLPLADDGGTGQLLFVGEVPGPERTPLDRAILSVWGVQVHVEALGRFELLADGVTRDLKQIPVAISAPGHTTAEVHLLIEDGVRRLADGTPVLLHTFILADGEHR